jgi:pentatricopeptide repeat protein
MQRLCHALLDAGPSVEAALRLGDAYALLVEFYVGGRHFDAAFKLLQDMRQRRIVLHPYLEQDVINDIHRQVGAGLPPEGSSGDGNGGGRSGSGGGGSGGSVSGRGGTGGSGGKGRGGADEEEEELGEELDEAVDEMDSDGEFGGK